ncbi:MAG: metal-dependent hydrolase [Candidatus Marinimicrobia bacterium]|nr:metal-dependent hydrolase [Candidatus Neomarinimicrobiota bacterium]
MPQAGLHAAVGNQFQRFIPYNMRLFPAIIFGAILPDLDVITVAIGSLFYPIQQAEHIFHRTFSHSFFTLILIYLLFSILGEWKKNTTLKSVGKGLVLGMLTHIVLDTFFWFREIHFLWPLPIEPFNLWRIWSPPEWFHRSMLVLEFFCFRWYAWFLINKHLQAPNKLSWITSYLISWKNIESVLFLLFILLGFWNPQFFKILFGVAYIPSLIMALWSTYMSRDALENNFNVKF